MIVKLRADGLVLLRKHMVLTVGGRACLGAVVMASAGRGRGRGGGGKLRAVHLGELGRRFQWCSDAHLVDCTTVALLLPLVLRLFVRY